MDFLFCWEFIIYLISNLKTNYMDFNKIKKLTCERGVYRCDSSLKYIVNTIEDYQAEGLELNPPFQRGHVWTEQQQTDYIEYVLRGGIIDPIKLNHTRWHEGIGGEFVCVDGLQRTTTFLKFMRNELKAFGVYMKDIENFYPLRFHIPFIINDLKTNKEVLKWYIELNSGGTPHTDEEINKVKRMLDEY